MPRLTPDATAHALYYVHGDVDIDGEVAIASGAILIAEPGSRLIIARGACIGTDVVIRARQGELIIEPEASVASGALIVGCGRIGAQSCVGSGSTVLNPNLAPRTVIPPRSLAGEVGRSEDFLPKVLDQEAQLEAESVSSPPEQVTSAAEPTSELEEHNHNGNGNGASSSHVYGREQVQQLLKTLFPHRQSLSTSPLTRSE
ncbi:MAG TPA: hypothetical protein V6D29_23035 [Leptolyngbyaceae cyanobacterium]